MRSRGGILNRSKAVQKRFEVLRLPVKNRDRRAHHRGQPVCAPHLQHLYAYLLENHFVQGVRDIKKEYLPIFSRMRSRKFKMEIHPGRKWCRRKSRG